MLSVEEEEEEKKKTKKQTLNFIKSAKGVKTLFSR